MLNFVPLLSEVSVVGDGRVSRWSRFLFQAGAGEVWRTSPPAFHLEDLHFRACIIKLGINRGIRWGSTQLGFT